MPSFQTHPFDPQTASAEVWSAYHVFRRTIAAELWPDDPVLSDDEVQTEMQRANPLWQSLRWLVFSGTEAIGSVWAGYRRPETADAAEHAPFLSAGGSVRADMRRQGIGTLLMLEILALMHATDKTVLTLFTHAEPGHAFLTGIGATAKFSAVESRAVLAELDWPRLRQWEEAAEASGLEWEVYSGRVPRDTLAALMPQFTKLAEDLPVGELELPPIKWEIAGYDQWYERMDRVGGAHHLMMLRAPDGNLAGLTESGWDARTPEIVYQQLTAVARSWRGRGIARALKAAMLQHVRSRHPQVRTIRTDNAETNAPIRAINARVGFKIHERHVTYQITRAALEDWKARQARPSADHSSALNSP